MADFTEFVKRSTKGNAEQIKEAQVNAYKFRKIYEDAMTKMTEEHDKEAKKRVQIAKQEAKDVADAEKFLVEAKIILTTNANTRMRLEEEKLHKERIDNLEQDKWILPDKQGEIYRLIEAETQRHKRRMGELSGFTFGAGQTDPNAKARAEALGEVEKARAKTIGFSEALKYDFDTIGLSAAQAAHEVATTMQNAAALMTDAFFGAKVTIGDIFESLVKDLTKLLIEDFLKNVLFKILGLAFGGPIAETSAPAFNYSCNRVCPPAIHFTIRDRKIMYFFDLSIEMYLQSLRLRYGHLFHRRPRWFVMQLYRKIELYFWPSVYTIWIISGIHLMLSGRPNDFRYTTASADASTQAPAIIARRLSAV